MDKGGGSSVGHFHNCLEKPSPKTLRLFHSYHRVGNIAAEEAMRECGGARQRPVPTDIGNPDTVVCGAGGTETRNGRDPRISGPSRLAMDMCRMRDEVQLIRSSSRTEMAAFGYVSISDDFARGATSQRLSRSWSANSETSMGGARKSIYGTIRSVGHSLVKTGEPESGRWPAETELG
jgi:hypothetical protein